MNLILLMKLFHIIASVLFLGSITVSILWKLNAHRSRDRQKLAFAFDGIIKSDRVFTMPAVSILFITGFGLSGMMKISPFTTGWIFWSLILFLISGIVYMVKIVPIQKKILALVSNQTEYSWEEYVKLSRQWDIWGTISTVTPYLALILMVYKYSLLT